MGNRQAVPGTALAFGAAACSWGKRPLQAGQPPSPAAAHPGTCSAAEQDGGGSPPPPRLPRRRLKNAEVSSKQSLFFALGPPPAGTRWVAVWIVAAVESQQQQAGKCLLRVRVARVAAAPRRVGRLGGGEEGNFAGLGCETEARLKRARGRGGGD